ncbi:MFS transporter [Pseudomonas juntendi]|uniref:MFS transporter n=1 Tax=Pseudomonas juntendi TaxID=2666183 RepID=UPI001F18EC80|nr:MFS transporter [Pseudomonas juntendi]MCO7058364.1 MFS transporter [Pseudomonas juntendi]UJM10692.1 MFS transporter [Pseudomonas juntendi]UXA40710.1 MFS transporter [Pseudomonas juntendi]
MKSMTYEFKIVLLLALLFGIVGLDRFVVLYLFPVIIPELGLNNMQAGAVASVLAFTWAISTWVLGSLSDKYGRKRVLIYSSVFFSLMTWMTALAKSFTSMLVVRGLLGVGEGGVFSTSVAAIAMASRPEKKGMNLGIHQAFFPLLGIGLGPIIATQLNNYMPWEIVFVVVGIPGLILAFCIAKVMKEPNAPLGQNSPHENAGAFAALRYRNIWVATVAGCFFQTGLFVFSTFVALYLTKVVGLELDTVGIIISGWGFGGFIGMIAMPAISDRLGRKPIMVACAAVYSVLMLIFVLYPLPPAAMFGLLFVAGIFGFGTAPIFLAIIPAETVPSRIVGSAVGIPTCVGEMLGGVVMPIVAGGLADQFGLQYPMIMVGVAFAAIAVVSIAFVETAPLALKAKGAPLATQA